jgi:cyclophilin family peptidyl-prolyl cis-trans isomerase
MIFVSACMNFLKLCKTKYYNFNLFHSIQRNFIAQTGDITGSGNGGESVFKYGTSLSPNLNYDSITGLLLTVSFSEKKPNTMLESSCQKSSIQELV